MFILDPKTPHWSAPARTGRGGARPGGAARRRRLAMLAGLDTGAARHRAGSRGPCGRARHRYRSWRGGRARRGPRGRSPTLMLAPLATVPASRASQPIAAPPMGAETGLTKAVRARRLSLSKQPRGVRAGDPLLEGLHRVQRRAVRGPAGALLREGGEHLPSPRCSAWKRPTAFLPRPAPISATGGTRAYYAAGPEYVQMPPFETFRDAESYNSTLSHETTHFTRHPSSS
jgi:hypothetical protein